MADRILFWAAVVICASVYFDWTARGLTVAGELEAAGANSVAYLAIVIPSAVMFFREVLRLLRH